MAMYYSCMQKIFRLNHKFLILAVCLLGAMGTLPFLKILSFLGSKALNQDLFMGFLKDIFVWKALWHTFIIGLSTTLVGGGIGVVLALFVGLTDTHRSHVWNFLVFLIFLRL